MRGGRLIVCRRAVPPKGGCGTVIDHGPAQWTVLFPLEQLPQAEAIVAQASGELDSYRT